MDKTNNKIGRKLRQVVKKPQGHTNEEDREYDEGKCTKVLWGLNIPAGVKDKGQQWIWGEKRHVVQSDAEISVPLFLRH